MVGRARLTETSNNGPWTEFHGYRSRSLRDRTGLPEPRSGSLSVDVGFNRRRARCRTCCRRSWRSTLPFSVYTADVTSTDRKVGYSPTGKLGDVTPDMAASGVEAA